MADSNTRVQDTIIKRQLGGENANKFTVADDSNSSHSKPATVDPTNNPFHDKDSTKAVDPETTNIKPNNQLPATQNMNLESNRQPAENLFKSQRQNPTGNMDQELIKTEQVQNQNTSQSINIQNDHQPK